MRTTHRVLLALILLLILSVLILVSFRTEYKFVPTEEILEMDVVEIFVARWEEPSDDFKNLKSFRKAMANPKNWDVFYRTDDPGSIKKVMAALAHEPIETYEMAGSVWRAVFFRDKGGKVKCTILNYDFERKEVHLADRIYGEELFDVLQDLLGFTYESREEIIERLKTNKANIR